MSEHERQDHDDSDTDLDAQGRDRKARLLQELHGEEGARPAPPTPEEHVEGGATGSTSPDEG